MAEPPDDGALVARARSGDRAALEQLLSRHYDRIAALAFRLLGDSRDAEDATQEALLAVVRGLDRFDGRAAFSTWAYRITTNTCLDELRRRRRRPETVELDVQQFGGTEVRTGQVDQRLEIDAALGSLPADFRVAVVLRDLCDLDYAEIADVLTIPAGTVRSRIARGRAQLADLLRGNQDAPTERPTEVP
jgi:RNA polymerase sigma-70 factor (ECF subfamily)